MFKLQVSLELFSLESVNKMYFYNQTLSKIKLARKKINRLKESKSNKSKSKGSRNI